MVITGGDIYAVSSDDAINSGENLIIGGGRVCAWSTGNDGIDANTEENHKLYIIGGTLVAIGGLENGAHLSQACWSASWSNRTWYALYADGQPVFAFQTPDRGGNTLVVSTSGTTTLQSGVTASGGTALFDGMGIVGGSASGGRDVDISAYSGGVGMGGPGMGGPGGGGPGGWR